MTREQIIKEIIAIDSKAVIVGGTSQFLQKVKPTAKDIDIVIQNFNPKFKLLGQCIQWKTRSPLSSTGIRAFVKRPDFSIDIFIEKSIPDYTIVSGIPCETILSMTKYYENIYRLYNPKKNWKQRRDINAKYKLLTGNELRVNGLDTF